MSLLLLNVTDGVEDALRAQIAQGTLAFLQKEFPAAQFVTYSDDDDLISRIQRDQVTVIVTSSFLSHRTVLVVQGLGVVIVSLGMNEELKDVVDIQIDPLIPSRPAGFYGPAYLLSEVFEEVDKTVVAERLGLDVETLQEEVKINEAELEIPAIISLFQKLEWDSEFFGFNVGHVKCRRLTPNIEKQVRSFVAREDIDLLEYQCDCHDRTSVLTAEQAGYSFVDIRMTFGQKLKGKYVNEMREGMKFRVATEEDIPELRKIAHNTYQDSRYYFDGNFDQEKLITFYEDWVEKAVHGAFDNCAYVVESDEKVAAFCSVRLWHRNAHIGLVGVDTAFRGTGLGVYLMHCVLDALQKQDIEHISVVTQGRNYGAQRLYQKCGFLTERTELWYHKWFR